MGRVVFFQSLLHPDGRTMMSGTEAKDIFGYKRTEPPASFLCQFFDNRRDGHGHTYDVWTASDDGHDSQNYLKPGIPWRTTAFSFPNPLAPADLAVVSRNPLAPADTEVVSRLLDVCDEDE
jgi:hypothetical protein